MEERIKQRQACFNQWIDGAITYVEMCNWLYANITPEENAEFEQYKPNDFMAKLEEAFA